jgi:parvulin-like peptidyl-prolyl isomerase
MMKYSKALLFLIPIIIYVACSHKPKTEDERLNDPRVVLQVGESKLTLGDIETKLGSKADYHDTTDEFNRKKMVVDKTVDQFLLVEGAQKAGFTAKIDSNTINRSLLKAYYNDKILSRVKVTDADIEDFFNKYGGQVQVGQIMVADSALAESLYTAVRDGADFGDLAKKFSQEPVSRDNGGSLGYRDYSGLVRYGNDFLNSAFTMKSGEISKPIHSRMGWHIVKAFDRIKNTKEFLDQDKAKYLEIANQYLQKKLVDDFIAKLKKDNHYEIVKPTVELLIQKSDSVKASGSKPAGLGSAAYLDSLAFTDAQKELYIIKFDDGGIKLHDLLKMLMSYDPRHLPDLQDGFVMEQIYEGLGVPPLLSKAAAKEGYDKTPSVIKDTENARSVLLAQQMRDKIYNNIPSVTEQEVQDYYNQHKDEFFVPKSMRVSAVASKTEAESKDLLARAKAGANIAALAHNYSIDKESGSNGGDLGFFTGDKRLSNYPEIYAAGENMKVGDLGGPVQMRGNWWVFKVTQWLEKTPKDLKQCHADIESRLSSEKRTSTYQSWLDQAKKDFPVTMNLDLIKNNLRTKALRDTTKSSGQ